MKTTKVLMLALAMIFGATVANATLKSNEAEVTFKSNLHCHNCKAKVEKNIPFEKGVEDLLIKLPENTIYVKYNTQKTTVEKLQKAIEKLGYSAEIISENKATKK
jgi:copper chaperone CopZ